MRAYNRVSEMLRTFVVQNDLPWPDKAVIEPPKDAKFGDMSANLALVLAKDAGMKPRDLAEKIRAGLAADPDIEKIDIAGPGFLNFTFTPGFWQKGVSIIAADPEGFASVDVGQGRKVQVEFVSANPTGPLHIGHGRGAALGDSLARILRRAGFAVQTEYYLNDSGRQMNMLGLTLWLRYQELLGRAVTWPEEYYRGEYMKDVAAELRAERGESLLTLPEAEALDICRQFANDSILGGIKKDLIDFRVQHDVWFSEKSLIDNGAVDKTFERLRASGLAFDQDGAFWFATTRYGDDKDRVLRKSDGSLTYFATDIAYHDNKYDRGFDLVVDIWGADHHGYVPRMKAAVQALGKPAEALEVILVQLVNLLSGGVQIAMSTRAGQFETLADVCKEVGADAARFIFLSRKSDSHLDFDLELVKTQSMDNPVYYVQYAHARICSLRRKAAEREGLAAPDAPDLSLLATPEDLDLLKFLDQLPDVVASAARTLSPHVISYYLMELAGKLHRYYTVHHILSLENEALIQARLTLMDAVASVLRIGLDLLGVDAPDRM